MQNRNVTTIGIIIVVVAVLGGAYLYFTGGLPQGSQEEAAQQQEFPELLSIAGRVTSINVAENSFLLLQPKEERSFTVKLGQETEFIRLVFPFDIANPPANATFTPERQEVTIEDLSVGDQVFVRGSTRIKTGQDIVNPLEIQILP